MANADVATGDEPTALSGTLTPEVTFVDAQQAEESGFEAAQRQDASQNPALQIVVREVEDLSSSAHSTNVSFDATISAGTRTVPVDVTASEGIDVIPQQDGSALVLPADPKSESHYGFIGAPVIVAEDGSDLPARFVEEGGQLTIVADNRTSALGGLELRAAFSYALTFNSRDISPGGFVSQPTALAELKRCFNCSFPLSGAAASFPAVGNVWNLSGPGGVAAPVEVTSANATTGQWTFTAQPGHFDAAGSTVSFAINQGRDNEFVLAVSANVVGSNVPEWLQRVAAENLWRGFAYNIWSNSPKA